MRLTFLGVAIVSTEEVSDNEDYSRNVAIADYVADKI